MIKGIIFDLGNTLIHFQGTWEAVVQEGVETLATWFIKKKRVRIDAPAFVDALITERRRGLAEAAESQREFLMHDGVVQALRSIDAPKRAEGIVEQGLRHFFQAEETAYQAFPDARATLKRLYLNGFKVGVFSNAPDDALVQRLVNLNELRPWVAPVFSSAAIGWRKPHPQGFEVIARRWKLPPESIVMVGDTLAADILGAQQAGMQGVLARMAENEENDQNRYIVPTATIDTLAELPGLLEQLTAVGNV